MPLQPGTRLGAYEITGPAGAGGMGEVYKARDTRLDRTVAIKILSNTLAGDPAFRARFDREARAISALNHPHICTLHDVGQEGSTAYLVMEYVDGEPVAGPMPPSRAIDTAIQICAALDAAHSAGIVHRDLKPSNILRTKSGVKLLDFGLATRGAAASSGGVDKTMTGPLTGAHTLLGTPQYMAPEQIEGREADARSDIFALGCIIYELVTGKRAFEGTSPSQVMAAILATEPRPMHDLQPIAPVSLDRVVARCLAKDPEERWQSVRDLKAALELVRQSAGDAPAEPRGRRRTDVIVLACVAALAVATLAFVLWRSSRARPAASIVRADIALEEPLAPESQGNPVAISRDGRVLAYLTGALPTTTLYVRRLDDPSGRAVKIAEGVMQPFFSPDGRWVAFGDMQKGQLLKTTLQGDGTPMVLAQLTTLRGAVWLPDDTIVYGGSVSAPLMRVAASGGAPKALTTLNKERGDKTHRNPEVLPDGKHIIFTAGNFDITSYEDASIVVQSIDGGPDRVLIEHGMFGRYVSSGHILYSRGSSVYAVPFDPVRLAVTGPAVPVLNGVRTHPVYGYADLAVSQSGDLVYAAGDSVSEQRRLIWVDRHGVRTPALPQLAQYNTGRPSPDGRRMLAEISAANNALWIADLDRDVTTRLTFHGDAYFGRWSPDGTHVAYAVGNSIREAAADGSGQDEVLVDGDRPLGPMNWSPDGRTLIYQEPNPAHGADLYVYDRATRTSRPWLATSFNETAGAFSPDGRWVAYISDESGRTEAYVRRFDGAGGRWQVSTGGADQLAWNPRGGEIILRHLNTFFAVPIALSDTPAIGAPVKLFDAGDTGSIVAAFGFGISSDGQRVLLRDNVPANPVRHLAVVLNWLESLRR